MDFIAGIDGGGTKTTLVYQTLTGETLGRETAEKITEMTVLRCIPPAGLRQRERY